MTANNESRALPDAELDIMRVIWSADSPLCASDIVKGLSGLRQWTTATVHVLLGRLCERGYLECDKSGYVHRYAALVTGEEYRKIESDSFLRRIAGGSARDMVASLIESVPLSDSDIDELTAILNQKRERDD